MKILLVDDEPVLLKNIIVAGDHKVCIALDGYQALDLLAQGDVYDLILLDLAMPNMDGRETLKRIRANQKLKNIYIIMLTANNQEESLISSLNEGADEYLTKPISPKRLLAHLGALERRLLPAEEAETLVLPSFHSLTQRESEILNLVVSGFSNSRIAAELFISELTVKNHLQKIYRKLGVNSRTQAAFLTRKKQLGQ